MRAKFYMPALIFLGAEHGASKQEVLSLKWKHINFDYRERGFIRFYRTKNSRERIEYLMPRTRQALVEWQKHQEWMRHRKKIDYNGSGIVFCRLDGTPIERFDKAWRTTCRIAGIRDFHFHDLRHTFCSNLLLSGSDLKDVKEMIGHGDLSMTDRYSHLTLDHKLHRQDRLADHYVNKYSGYAFYSTCHKM
jgi:integrase